MPPPQVDRWLFINLAHRTDRRAGLEAQLTASGLADRAERIDAVKNKNGHLGCTRSHIKTLEYAYAHPEWAWVGVLEDDFDWRDPASARASLDAAMAHSDAFDVFLLAFSCPGEQPIRDERTQLFRVNRAHTTSGYVIRREFIPVLLDVFRRGECAMRMGGKPNVYTVDQAWTPLQRTSQRFFTTVPSLGHQRPDFSDIEGHFYADRGC